MFFKNLFKKTDLKKPLSNKDKITSLKLGSYVTFNLNPDICNQLLNNRSSRYELDVLNKHQVKGLVKAIYQSDLKNYYIELVSLHVENNIASRREYVVFEHEITHIYSSKE